MKENTRINVIVNIIRTLVLTLLSFITFPWICRYLGDSMVGAYTWANTFVAYFLILAKIGIPNLAVRECVKVRDDKEKLSNKVQGFFLLQLIATMVSFGLMSMVVFSVPALRESSALIFILSINFIVGAFSFEWDMQRWQEIRKNSIGLLMHARHGAAAGVVLPLEGGVPLERDGRRAGHAGLAGHGTGRALAREELRENRTVVVFLLALRRMHRKALRCVRHLLVGNGLGCELLERVE